VDVLDAYETALDMSAKPAMIRNCRLVRTETTFPPIIRILFNMLPPSGPVEPLPIDGPTAHRNCIRTLAPPKALWMRYPITALELENNVVINVPAPTIAPVAMTA